ncbi:MAG: GNAT family N-acetyltransferase [Dehalococcoidia bacterium]
MHVFLETERMVLRRLTGADAELLCELDSDPEVMRWLSGGAPTPLELIRDEILPRFMSYYDQAGGLGYWAANEKESREFLGWFALHPVDDRPGDEAEVGYRLRRAAWGKGYATEGVRALLRKGFEEHGLLRVFGTTYEENVASRRVMEKAGMRLVRTFRLSPEDATGGGTYVSTGEAWDGDDVEYAIERGPHPPAPSPDFAGEGE